MHATAEFPSRLKPLDHVRDSVLLLTMAAYSAGYATAGLGVLALVAAAEVARRSWRWIRSALDLPLLGVFLAVLLSALASPWRPTALLSVAALALVAGVAVRATLALAQRGLGALHRLLLIWVAGGVAAALWGLARAQPGGFVAASTAMLEQNGLGSTLALALVLAVGQLICGTRRQFLPLGAAVLVLLGGLTVTFARASWLGAGAGLLTLLVAAPPRARRLLAAGLVAAVVVAVVGVARWPMASTEIHSIASLEANRNRLEIWAAAVRIAADHPLLGTGFGTFALAYPRYRTPGAVDPFAHFAHNILLNVAAETGIVGLVAFLTFFAAGLRAIWRWWRRAPPESLTRGLAGAVLAATVTLLVVQLFDGTVMFVHLGVSLFVLLALGAAGERGVLTEDPARAAG